MYLMIIYYRDMTSEDDFIEQLKCNKLGKYLIDNDLEVAEYQIEEAIEYLESKA